MRVTIAGSRVLPADNGRVWAALHDADRLSRCVPGCETLSQISPSLFALAAAVAVGPVRVLVEGTVTVAGSVPTQDLTLVGRCRKRFLGSVVGTARIHLCEAGDGRCRLRWSVEARSQGPLNALGPTVTAGVATALVDRFLDRLGVCLTQPTVLATRAGIRRPAPSRQR